MWAGNFREVQARIPKIKQILCPVVAVAVLLIISLYLNGFRANEPQYTLNEKQTIRKNLTKDLIRISLEKTVKHLPDLQRYVTTKEGRLRYKNITFYPPDCSSKLLVYVCNADLPCGGLADRQKGIMSTFILAILTNRTFVVNNTAPCDMETVAPPSIYNWTKCRSKIYLFPNDTLTNNDFMLGWGSPFTFPKFFEQYNGSDLWNERVVNLKVNSKIYKIMRKNPKAKVVLPWLLTKPEENILKHVMELLFSYSNGVRYAIQRYQELYFNQKYMICAHFRVGAKGAERTYLDSRDISNMVSFMASHILDIVNQSVVYIATDSTLIKEKVKKVFPSAISLNSTIGHIDVERKKSSCAATFTSVLEEAILSQCDSILLTWSGFSRMATLIGGKASHIFVYHISKGERTFNNYTLHSLAEGYGLS